MNGTITIILLSVMSALTLGAQTIVSADLRRAVDQARVAGLDSAFLNRVAGSFDAEFYDKAIRINLTNYSNVPDYSGHYNRKSVKQVKAFMKENDSLLRAVQKKRGVSKEIISAILWIESRCGTTTGKFHVPSVFLSLLLADDSTSIQLSVANVTKGKTLDSLQMDSVYKQIALRARNKSAWSIKQLQALEAIDKRGVMNVTTLKGSWAGAFGFPQFIPSSYNSWAVDGNGDGVIDLYTLPDAAHSIANYLRSNGWTSKKDGQRKAVHHYNNSDAYVNAVFTLAGKL